MTSDTYFNPIRPDQPDLMMAPVLRNSEGDAADAKGGSEVDDADGKMKDREDVEGEARRPKPAARPYTPTKEEVREHEVTHLPFRPWCRHCVFGKGCSSPHPAPDGREKIGITISLDYCFMADEVEEGLPGVLVLWDDHRECLWALPVDRKGATDWVVKWVTEKLDNIGYRGEQLTLKSDQEPAITALKMAIAATRVGKTVPIESPVRESRSNGAGERAIRTWQAQMRTMKSHFDENIGTKLPVSHPLTGWLVLWASEVLLKFVVRPCGRTAYEKITGHRVKHPMAMFGETVNFMLKQDESRRKRMKTETDWSTGIFVGVEPRTGEALVINEDGLFKCRTLRRVPREEAFHVKWLENATTPVDEFVNKGAMTTFPGGAGVNRHTVEGSAPVPAGVGKAYIPRRTRLTPQDFVEYGYTDGCRGCQWFQTGIGGRQNHSSDCRQRIEAELEKTEEGQERLDKSKERIDHWVVASEAVNIEQGNPAQPEAVEEVGPQPEAGPPEHMNQEIENVDKDAGGDVLLPQARAAENFSIGTPTNSPEKSAVGDTHLEEKRIKVSERRIATPERNQPQKRRGSVDKDSPAKRLILDDDGADPDETNEALGIPAFDMEFEDPGDIRDEGAAGSSDPMIGFFKGLNIVDLT